MISIISSVLLTGSTTLPPLIIITDVSFALLSSLSCISVLSNTPISSNFVPHSEQNKASELLEKPHLLHLFLISVCSFFTENCIADSNLEPQPMQNTASGAVLRIPHTGHILSSPPLTHPVFCISVCICTGAVYITGGA